MELDDVKSPLPGDEFTYDMTISRFDNAGVNSLRILGTITYTKNQTDVRRLQSLQNLAIPNPGQLDLNITWQFLSNPDTQVSVSSLVFERVF
jgi:hypothetical protein